MFSSDGRKLKGKWRKNKHGFGVIVNMKCSGPNVAIPTTVNMESSLSEWVLQPYHGNEDQNLALQF